MTSCLKDERNAHERIRAERGKLQKKCSDLEKLVSLLILLQYMIEHVRRNVPELKNISLPETLPLRKSFVEQI